MKNLRPLGSIVYVEKESNASYWCEISGYVVFCRVHTEKQYKNAGRAATMSVSKQPLCKVKRWDKKETVLVNVSSSMVRELYKSTKVEPDIGVSVVNEWLIYGDI
ncbi:hypothetical protein T4B_6225 [Trichinella pseudospiralis]|uniref:Uncharacterized protein n=1 Tax=Trichinella pseudospiralis TaxID=6337 RepID=A0A0V1JE84_TRIPS|nr:hypothetical protein T4B_6225 [Trichinella pseudospiralis]